MKYFYNPSTWLKTAVPHVSKSVFHTWITSVSLVVSFFTLNAYAKIPIEESLIQKSESCSITNPKEWATAYGHVHRIWKRASDISDMDGYSMEPMAVAFQNVRLSEEVEEQIMACFSPQLRQAHLEAARMMPFKFTSALTLKFYKDNKSHKNIVHIYREILSSDHIAELMAIRQAFGIFEKAIKSYQDDRITAVAMLESFMDWFRDAYDCHSMAYTGYDFVSWLENTPTKKGDRMLLQHFGVLPNPPPVYLPDEANAPKYQANYVSSKFPDRPLANSITGEVPQEAWVRYPRFVGRSYKHVATPLILKTPLFPQHASWVLDVYRYEDTRVGSEEHFEAAQP